MTPQNLKIYALINAKIADIEAMKAENESRIRGGKALAYDEGYFYAASDEIKRLAQEINVDENSLCESGAADKDIIEELVDVVKDLLTFTEAKTDPGADVMERQAVEHGYALLRKFGFSDLKARWEVDE